MNAKQHVINVSFCVVAGGLIVAFILFALFALEIVSPGEIRKAIGL